MYTPRLLDVAGVAAAEMFRGWRCISPGTWPDRTTPAAGHGLPP
ncbi:hypothetical protein [Mycolicibacterium komossense]|nr:hypothetical protein [Mycolicibacterium komossense]